MIIDPYNISINSNDNTQLDDKDKLIEESIMFLVNKYNNLLENKKYDEIKNILLKKFISNNIKINNPEINNIIKEILNKIFGYGILQEYIDDEVTTDIRAVSYNNIYVKQLGKWIKSEVRFKSKNEFNEFIRYSVLKNSASINYEQPIIIVSDRINHLRIEAGIDPVNVKESNIVIRIHKDHNAKSLEILFAKYDMINKDTYIFLGESIKKLKNILIVGKGGSGKTTLLRSIIDKLPKEIAISTNEETAELYLEDRNIIQREILIRKTEEKSIDLEKLARHSLVMSNDVIVIGELKGKEASTFFDAISTGHVGYTTIHADSIENSIDRLIVLIKKDIKAQGYTDAFLRRFITSSLDYIIFMKDYKIEEIASLKYNADKNQINKDTIYMNENILNKEDKNAIT